MSDPPRLVAVGRVGRAHGVDGSFYVDRADGPLDQGSEITLAGRVVKVLRRGGTPERPLVRLAGITSREEVGRLRGQPLLASLEAAPLDDGEWLVEDLVGCRVPGLGEVSRVISGPSCDVLEVGEEAVLVPLISDAVKQVDLDERLIHVDLGFLSGAGSPPEAKA